MDAGSDAAQGGVPKYVPHGMFGPGAELQGRQRMPREVRSFFIRVPSGGVTYM